MIVLYYSFYRQSAFVWSPLIKHFIFSQFHCIIPEYKSLDKNASVLYNGSSAPRFMVISNFNSYDHIILKMARPIDRFHRIL